ncbi:protein of unknown function [Candidatus Methylomirabilis oxygeniifera]|uniref:Uncharacterized protein n=1 Tax=Methylomirabilis oxygeniifera TaxID=671143 RepID=D5MEM0_METO1|nr:protein of unknown function [Candidatus Methylomirabilis oxyfera]
MLIAAYDYDSPSTHGGDDPIWGSDQLSGMRPYPKYMFPQVSQAHDGGGELPSRSVGLESFNATGTSTKGAETIVDDDHYQQRSFRKGSR